MHISAIVAMANNRVIGRHNQIPWYLPADLKFFKKTTVNHHVIMGRQTFHSIGRPLPNRTNIVVTRDVFFLASGCIIAHSVEEALQLASHNGEEEAFIIGGGQIYEQSLPYWDRIYLTHVAADIEGDIFFPEINFEEWTMVSSEPHLADDRHAFDYTFCLYEKKH